MFLKFFFISFLYQVFLHLIAFLALPRYLYALWFQNKYRSSWRSKLGLNSALIKKNGSLLIWIHAVSLGETRAISALAKQLKTTYPQAQFVVSSGTETGHAEAKVAISFADHFIYLPFDFSWAIRKVLMNASPDLVILSETDLWFNFLSQAKRQGATVVVANAKISDKSLSRFLKLQFFSRPLMELCHHFCVQNGLYASRLKLLGVSDQRLTITGNLKFDQTFSLLTSQQIQDLKKRFGIDPQDVVIAIGSTHGMEEEAILKQLETVRKNFSSLKVIIAPRHPERFQEVAKVLKKMNLSFCSYSSVEEGKEKPTNPSCILWDTMGKLQIGYQMANVAIVGGSFVSHVGGHNILEPSHFGIPVLFGPHMQKQKEFVDLVLKAQAGKQIELKQIPEALQDLFSNEKLRLAMGESGLRLSQSNQGATARTLGVIQDIWKKK